MYSTTISSRLKLLKGGRSHQSLHLILMLSCAFQRAALPALDIPPLPPPALLPKEAVDIDDVVPASAIPKELELDERVLDERERVLQAEVVSVEYPHKKKPKAQPRKALDIHYMSL